VLKTLRRKFVLISMVLVFIIITIVLFAGIIFTNIHFKRDYETAVQRELALDIMRQPRYLFKTNLPLPGHPPQRERITFSAVNKGDTWELMTPWMQIDSDTLLTLCARAEEAENQTGFWADIGIAYSKQEGRIAFANMQNEYSQLKNNRLIWTLVYIGALGLFFLLSLLLSSHALKPAELAWEQQQRFISDASHELKTPLTVILANLDIMENEQGSNQWLSAAKTEGLMMKKLIENLLFLARSDEMREPVEHEPLNLSDLVSEMSLAFEAPAYEKNLTIDTDIKPNQTILGNEDLLRQLMSILLDNAVKYTPEGGEIKISLKKSQDKLMLTVYNSKVYIAKEQQEKLFDRFYRIDKARSKPEGGYGLGLSIAAEIARQHGASLKVSSLQGSGTSFILAIPI